MKKNLILKVFIGILISLVFCSVGFTYILQNGSGKGYDGDGRGGDNATNSSIIDAYIEEGGGYFLKAHSDFLLFLNKFEMQNLNGIDYSDWQQLLESALNNIKNAKEIYSSLIEVANATPYNQSVISDLKGFNYISYMIENSLYPAIFKDVEDYLKAGDIRGVHTKIYSGVVEIEALLNSIIGETSLSRLPKLEAIWRLNEKFFEVHLFGEYVARIFSQF